ncbi:MAG: ATP-dependent DNA helicase RecG [Devosiaceae bacterium]|nr:ATP-dependent DNA helicase RecG [Devosiaceae bacterium]
MLNPFFTSLRSFKGVGPRLNSILDRLFMAGESGGAQAVDLLMHMPERAIDRRKQVNIAQAEIGEICTLKLHIDRHIPAPRGRRSIPHRIEAHDESGEISLIFFGNNGGWVERMAPVGEIRHVSGEVAIFNGKKQIVHPDYVVEEDKFSTMPLVEPIYPLTHGLSHKVLNQLSKRIVETIPDLDEWIDNKRIKANNWPSFKKAMELVHNPENPDDLSVTGPARMRLAYDEYLAGQLTLQLIRSQMVVEKGIARQIDGDLSEKLLANLPYELTGGQKTAIDEIEQDLKSGDRMARLLQGDVGSGKTIVALMAMVSCAQSGAQSALMAPTELLANQHFATLKPLCDSIGLNVVLVTGKMRAAARREALEKITSGDADIIVGTHALFQTDISFFDLGLSVVDEQHRFGVHQRLALSKKGQKSDLLVMTATPIPRTLILTHFGDMAISLLQEKPAGRQPIDTAALPFSSYGRVVQRLKNRIVDDDAQAYWVCPLVEESELVELVSAIDRHGELAKEFGNRVGLIHGRMKPAQKQQIMQDFINGELSVLVATTVIEVGVDVPNATIMIIEHAERFGLSQLHQLRGRVGRGAKSSSCLLMYKEPLGEIAAARLDILKETEDGFKIAEQDLKLRGSGDLLGTRQSGMPGYRLVIPDVHQHLLEIAHNDARDILQNNPGLTGPHGEALRNMLYIFRRDLAIELIRSG